MGIAPNRHQFTVEDYHFLAEQGKFKPDARLELIEGEIFEMSPIGRLHARCVNFLLNILAQRFAGKFITSGQNPIAINNTTSLNRMWLSCVTAKIFTKTPFRMLRIH